MTDSQTMTPGDTSLPLFYSRPEALAKDRHADVALIPGPDYRFAAKTNAVPLMAAEMAQAGRSYPIVFAGAAKMPVALVGIKSGENVYLTRKGGWERGHYIPAYLRRYPFVLAGDEGAERLTLCLDMDADAVTTTDKRGTTPLFEDGEPTEAVRSAIAFCEEYQAMYNTTRAIVAQIEKHDLLTEQSSKITLPKGKTHTVAGFFGVDEAKLSALSDEAFLELRKSGALTAIYCLLCSTHSWQALINQRD